MILNGYKHTLDYAIVEILDTQHSSLKYHELAEKIEKYCKISSSTLTRHLRVLARRSIVERTLFNNGRATYSLTKKFKDASEMQRRHYPISYLKETCSLETFSIYTLFYPRELPRPRSKDYWPERERKAPRWMPPSWRREFYKKRRELSKNYGKAKHNRRKIT